MLVEIKGWNTTCDVTGKKSDHVIAGFARGATGRVCCVMAWDFDSFPQYHDNLSTLEEVREFAEEVEGGYLDF